MMPFSIAQYRFELDPVEEILLPAQNKGIILRGAFGKVFKEACCPHWPDWRNRECAGPDPCPIRERCAYAIIFEPSPTPGSDRLSLNQDIPRPFVFKPPLEEKTNYGAGEHIGFDLILAGKAREYLPYFIVAFRELGEQGIGTKRNGRRGRFRFFSVTAPNVISESAPQAETKQSVVYSHSDNLVRNIPAKITLQEITERANALDPYRVTIRFLTPTILKHENQVIREPEFHHIVKRLRDRINALATFYGDGPLPWDFKGMGERAEKVKRIQNVPSPLVGEVEVREPQNTPLPSGGEARVRGKSGFHWIEAGRRSTKGWKKGITHDLSGFIGEATYEGDIREFLPLLILGEYLHVGKSAAFGLGRYELIKCSPLPFMGEDMDHKNYPSPLWERAG